MTEEEAKLGQRFKIDVVVELNDQAAYETDDAENTVNYVEIYSLVQSIFENQRFNLIEAVLMRSPPSYSRNFQP